MPQARGRAREVARKATAAKALCTGCEIRRECPYSGVVKPVMYEVHEKGQRPRLSSIP